MIIESSNLVMPAPTKKGIELDHLVGRAAEGHLDIYLVVYHADHLRQ